MMHKNKTWRFKGLTLDLKIFLQIIIKGGFGGPRDRDRRFRIPENPQKNHQKILDPEDGDLGFSRPTNLQKSPIENP